MFATIVMTTKLRDPEDLLVSKSRIEYTDEKQLQGYMAKTLTTFSVECVTNHGIREQVSEDEFQWIPLHRIANTTILAGDKTAITPSTDVAGAQREKSAVDELRSVVPFRKR